MELPVWARLGLLRPDAWNLRGRQRRTGSAHAAKHGIGNALMICFRTVEWANQVNRGVRLILEMQN
jgi:hypothetical protein